MFHGDARRGVLADGPFRYLLWRRWADAATVLFVMLNPSTADETRDDPTIRRCLAYARAWGFGALEVVNLFAFRASQPRQLRRAGAPVGPYTDGILRSAVARASAVIAAWGNDGARYDRSLAVTEMIGRALRVLGITRTGAPRHPLYAPANARPRLHLIR